MDNEHTFTSAQRIYNYARYVLVSLILLTLVGIASLAVSDIYVVSGVFLSLILSVGTKSMGSTAGFFSAALILIPYMLCFFLSKRKRGWLIAALVMVCIDTLVLIFVALSFGRFITFLIDILYHGSALVLLGRGVKNGKAATAAQESDPYHPAEAMKTPVSPEQ